MIGNGQRKAHEDSGGQTALFWASRTNTVPLISSLFRAAHSSRATRGSRQFLEKSELDTPPGFLSEPLGATFRGESIITVTATGNFDICIQTDRPLALPPGMPYYFEVRSASLEDTDEDFPHSFVKIIPTPKSLVKGSCAMRWVASFIHCEGS